MSRIFTINKPNGQEVICLMMAHTITKENIANTPSATHFFAIYEQNRTKEKKMKSSEFLSKGANLARLYIYNIDLYKYILNV